MPPVFGPGGTASDSDDGRRDGMVVERAARGDPEAFEVVVRRYAPVARVFARRMLGHGAEVDVVVRDAFVTAWHHLPRLADPTCVQPWLLRIVGRRAIEAMRARPAPTGDPDVGAGARESAAVGAHDPSWAVDGLARLDALSDALDALDDAERVCWVLHEYSGCSVDAVARELDLPVGSVRHLLAGARRFVLARTAGWQ